MCKPPPHFSICLGLEPQQWKNPFLHYHKAGLPQDYHIQSSWQYGISRKEAHGCKIAKYKQAVKLIRQKILWVINQFFSIRKAQSLNLPKRNLIEINIHANWRNPWRKRGRGWGIYCKNLWFTPMGCLCCWNASFSGISSFTAASQASMDWPLPQTARPTWWRTPGTCCQW